eukprot:3654031-Pyramimonas_sp.AAC.1
MVLCMHHVCDEPFSAPHEARMCRPLVGPLLHDPRQVPATRQSSSSSQTPRVPNIALWHLR